MSRSFTVLDYPQKGETYGRYLANTPKRAANKAFTQLSRLINLKNTDRKNMLVFTLKETTSGSNHKNFKYAGTRVKLHKPLHINRGGKDIVYSYKNVLATFSNVFVN